MSAPAGTDGDPPPSPPMMLPFMNPELSPDERAADLVSRLAIEEKAPQMLHDAPAIPRLGIPAYNWWNEGLHGVARAGIATVFPQAIGLGAMWSARRLHEVAVAISDEARAKHHEYLRQGDRGMYKGLTIWSPNINIFRDPRWGRGHETYGECPYLTARLGVAFCRGLQGEDPRYLKTVATPKHYAVHSGPEALRHGFDAVVSEKDLRETYLPAFEACVTEAKAESVMAAYNRVNGEPCSGSPTLLGRILRGEWCSAATWSATAGRSRISTRATTSPGPGKSRRPWPSRPAATSTAAAPMASSRSPSKTSCSTRPTSTPACGGCSARACGWACSIRPSASPTPRSLTRRTTATRTARWRARPRARRWCC